MYLVLAMLCIHLWLSECLVFSNSVCVCVCVCVFQVLKGAAVLQIECLQRRCEEFLSRSLSISNCISRWRLAHWHSCMHLRDRVSHVWPLPFLPFFHPTLWQDRYCIPSSPCHSAAEPLEVKTFSIYLDASGSVQLSPLTDWVIMGTWWTYQQRPFSTLFFLQGAVVSSSGMGRDVHSLMLFIQHSFSSADHGITRSSGCPEKWFWRGWRGVWRGMCLNHVSFHLSMVARRGSCGPTRRSVFVSTHLKWEVQRCFLLHLASEAWILYSDSESTCGVHVSHSHRGGWMWQETFITWTRLWSWWYCFTRSCLAWPLLPLCRQSWCRFLLSRCHPCA